MKYETPQWQHCGVFLCINEIDKNLNQEKQTLHCCHRVMWLSIAS